MPLQSTELGQKRAAAEAEADALKIRELGQESARLREERPFGDDAGATLQMHSLTARHNARLQQDVEIVTLEEQTSRVAIGSTVRIKSLDTEEEKTIVIGGYNDAFPQEGLISYESPLGSALLGLEQGDWVSTATALGEIEVLEILPPSAGYMPIARILLQRARATVEDLQRERGNQLG